MATVGVMVVALLALTTAVVFCTTNLDLTVARWFSTPDSGHGRWAWDHVLPVQLLYRYGTWPAIATGAIALLLACLASCCASLRPWRRGAIFVLLSLIIGPGLMVNAISKDHCGRSRPRDLVEFGGEHLYTPPGTIVLSDSGKAFPCGHSSIGFAVGLSLGLFWWRSRPKLAWGMLTVGTLYGCALGLARMSAGAHFLSDVLWSAYIPALVALPLWRMLCPPEPAPAMAPLPGTFAVASAWRARKGPSGAIGRCAGSQGLPPCIAGPGQWRYLLSQHGVPCRPPACSCMTSTSAWTLAAGTLSLVRGGRHLHGILAHAVVRVAGELRRIDLRAQATLFDGERGDIRRALVQADHGSLSSELQIEIQSGDPWIRVVVLLRAIGAPVTIEEIHPCSLQWSRTHLASEVPAARWWVTPVNGWDRPGTRPLGGATHPDDCPTTAYDIGGAYAPSGSALTFGHILPTRWINRIDADVHGVAVRSTVGVTVPANGTLTSDPLLLDPVRGILDALGSLTARHQGRRQPAESASHWGWNTWDYHTDKMVEGDVERAITAIKAHPWMASRLRYLIIDDAWQDLTGDWQPGSRFGSIQRAATTIAAAGFTPGIWSAPFFVDRHSQLMAAQPDLALKLKDGQYYSHCMGCDPPWGDRIYLDPTHPGVPEHLYRLYRRLAHWGFGYFKTDFLHNAISPVFPGDQARYRDQIRYHNPGLGLVRAHRSCMEAIRAAIGPDAFWLGCGTHYASGAGLMDATRISGDMRVHYPNLLICARSVIFDFHIHGGAFLLDPDFAVFRGRDTVLPGGLEVAAEGA